HSSTTLPTLHSFPTRRSSDLQNLSFPFSMLALNPTACDAIKVSGDGVVEAHANVQSNSNGTDPPTCGGVGFSRIGGSTINVIAPDRKSTRLNSSHVAISYAVF